MTSRALLDRTGTEARMLGVEFDVGLRIPLAEGVRLELQMAYLFPGAALGPALELDGAVLGRPYFGGDPAFKADTGLIFTF
jgi:hypothetical protein